MHLASLGHDGPEKQSEPTFGLYLYRATAKSHMTCVESWGFCFAQLTVEYLPKFGFYPGALGIVLIRTESTLKWGTGPSC